MKTYQKKFLSFILKFQTQLGLILLILAIIIILIPSLPQIWYRVFPESTNEEVTSISQVPSQPNSSQQTSQTNKLPVKDSSLPKTNYIIIPSIGVRSPMKNSKNYEEVLKVGSWMVNDFPTPNELKKPVIVASHRFGYLDWSTKERREISFYNLPKLKNGDIVEIVWDQRKYKYKIVDSSEGANIKSYNHDLILYTCKLYNSPTRIFKYAQRIIE